MPLVKGDTWKWSLVVPYSAQTFYMVEDTNRKLVILVELHRRHFSSRFLAKITFYAVIELALEFSKFKSFRRIGKVNVVKKLWSKKDLFTESENGSSTLNFNVYVLDTSYVLDTKTQVEVEVEVEHKLFYF